MKPREHAGLSLIKHIFFVFSIAALLFGCTEQDAKPARLDIATKSEESTEDDWLRKQQMIHRVRIDDNGVRSESDVPPSQAWEDAGNYCYSSNMVLLAPNNCEFAYRNALYNACQARMLLALAAVQSEPLRIPGGVSSVTIYDSMTESAAAAVAKYAIYTARRGLKSALEGLTTPDPSCKSGSQWIKTESGLTISLASAQAVSETYYLAIAAYERTVEATVNASENLRSSTPSPQLAKQREISGSELSRTAAAHLLVGGDPGLLGSTSQAFCLGPELAPQAQAALQLLRDSGVPPAELASTSSTASIVDCPLSGLPCSSLLSTAGSVRQRLGAFYGVPELTSGGETIETHYGLAISDFDAARTYLKQEVSAFSRSQSAQIAAVSGYRRFSGIYGEPRPLPNAAWSALARHTALLSPWYAQAGGVWDLTPPPESLTGPMTQGMNVLISAVHVALRGLLSTTDNFAASGDDPTSMRNQVLGLASSILASNHYQGTVELLAASNSLAGYAHGFNSSDRVRVVVGEDGLRCALDGSIEGATCYNAVGVPANAANFPCAAGTDPSLACLTVAVLTTDYPSSTLFGMKYFVGTSRSGLTVAPLQASKTRFYFVKPKSPNLPDAPGNYEVLGGTTIPSSLALTTTPVSLGTPIIPMLDEKVARVLAPDRKQCSLPRVSCAGVSMDARLPLEDELTDDGNGVENSWKHYLELARQAANEADLLAKEYRDAKLNTLQATAAEQLRQEEQNQAADAALQEVQAACGTSIDGRKLVALLSTGSPTTCPSQGCDLGSAFGGATCTTTCPAFSGQRCIAGRCIADLGALADKFPNDSDIARLRDCLDTSTLANADFVTLGSQPLCVYTDHNNPNSVCPAALLNSAPCPSPKPAASACPSMAPALDVTVAEPLSFYKSDDPGPLNSASTTPICQLFRTARTNKTKADLDRVAQTNLMYSRRMTDRIGEIGFVAKYGGYVAITEDGVERWSTGSFSTGAINGWPRTSPSTCTGLTGLFCPNPPLGMNPTPQQVGAMNERIFKAAFLAGVMSGLKLPATYLAKLGNDLETWRPCDVLYQFGSGAPLGVCKRDERRAYLFWGTGPSTAWIAPDGVSVAPPVTFDKRDFVLGNTAALQGRWYEDFYSGLSLTNIWTGDGLAKKALLNQVPENAPFSATIDGKVFSTGNYPFFSDSVLTAGNILDGLEILCELASAHETRASQVMLGTSLTTLEDVDGAGSYLQSLAESLNKQASTMVFARVPRLAIKALGDAPAIGAFPALGGQMGEEVSRLREALISSREALPIISGSMQQVGAEMQGLRARLEQATLEKDVLDLSTLGATLDRITQCATAITNAATVDVVHAGGAATGAAITCANSVAQIGIALRLSVLKKASTDAAVVADRAAFAERMSQISQNIQAASLNLQEAGERVNGALSAIEGLRNQARLKMAEAVYRASSHAQKQIEYEHSLGTVAAATQVRYQTALKNAKLMAFYAKRAIEQRLGMKLSEMRDRLPLVDAPQSWEGTICTRGTADQPDFATASVGDANAFFKYGDGFIGDYVTKLENVVESYRLSHNFHEGQDQAVVSLRDDVMNVRSACRVPTANLLKFSAQLDNAGGWMPRNCAAVTFNGSTSSTMNCISAVRCGNNGTATPPCAANELALDGLPSSVSGAPGFYLQFGDGKTCAGGSPGTTPPQAPTDPTLPGCGWKPGSALTQIVTLDPGRYRFSWYTKEASGSGGARSATAMIRSAGTAAAPMVIGSTFAVGPGNGWKRVSVEFTTPEAGDYEVGFGVTDTTRPTYAVTVAAAMLEKLFAGTQLMDLAPFRATGSTTTTIAKACQDTDGDQFRLKNFRRQCVHLCNTGFSSNCTTGPEYCYRELSFGVSQPWIQNGKLFSYSGFARGNFNYRIDSLALNFVGSGIRDCSTSTLPNTCYNAGFVPYSLEHNGPFWVRNDIGGDFRAYLFDGRIEHARGLALERYISNPLGSTDRELLTDYMRKEFQGRPLDGSFVLRVWEEPGVNFDAIEDIQLILNYRYWTRFD